MHQHQVEVECKVKAIPFLICSVSVSHPHLSLSPALSQLAHSPSVTYCQSAAVKFCEQGAEIVREEPCLDTSRCGNQADDPNDWESSGRKRGKRKLQVAKREQELISLSLTEQRRLNDRNRKKTEPELQLQWLLSFCWENTFFLSRSAASVSASFSSHPPGMHRNLSTLLPFIPHPSLFYPLPPLLCLLPPMSHPWLPLRE